MPKIEQLPSGSFRARVFVGTDADGKKHYKSITGTSRKDVKLKIAEFETKKDEAKVSQDMTVASAIKNYIDVKSNIMSPSTVRGYNVILRNRLKKIMGIQISDLTLSDIQSAINEDAKRCSPKTIRNTNALLKSSIELVAPNFRYSVTLPQKIKKEIQIPTEAEVAKLFETAKGHKIETALYLAAMCGMRRSEICALMWKDVDLKKGTISINSASVPDKDNRTIRKGTKTTASTRTIKMFAPVVEHIASLERTSEFVQNYTTPNSITDGFKHLLHRAGVQHYRFHDLRHYAASVMLMLNLPKKYISAYMGHETTHMLDTVYGHIMSDKKENMYAVVDDYFADFSSNMTQKMTRTEMDEDI